MHIAMHGYNHHQGSSDEHGEAHKHGEGHSHAHEHSEAHSHAHEHSEAHSHAHEHSEAHSHAHEHSEAHNHSGVHDHPEADGCGPIVPGECGPIFRPRARRTSRRAFLGDFGKGTMAMAVVTPILAAACSSDGAGAEDGAGSGEGSSTTGQSDTSVASTEAPGGDDSSDQAAGEDLRWGRVNLGFVSAYVLARGNKAAVVDTGTAGSGAMIGETLSSMGLNYGDVDHVILTHHHGDHVGSLSEVTAEATSAAIYAGEPDVAAIGVDGIVPLVGDEDVFGLRMIATPGHTAGHMSVYDEATGLLMAGDAIFTEGGGAVEGPERFFSDIPQSRESIKVMAALSFDTLIVGHGEPIEGNADTAVADLAASLS